nr:hypothetical protein [Leisingera sp.]
MVEACGVCRTDLHFADGRSCRLQKCPMPERAQLPRR